MAWAGSTFATMRDSVGERGGGRADACGAAQSGMAGGWTARAGDGVTARSDIKPSAPRSHGDRSFAASKRQS